MHDLVKLPADQVRNVAEHLQRDRIHLRDAEIRIDEVHAERRLIQQSLKLLALVEQGAFGFTPHSGDLEMGGHSGQQLFGAKRLDEIVVRAPFKPFDPRFFSGTSRQENDRQRLGLRAPPQFAQQAESVYLWHHDIGQHEIRRIGVHSRKRDAAVTDGFHVVVLTQETAQIPPHVRIVVHNEHAQAGLRTWAMRKVERARSYPLPTHVRAHH